MGTELVALAIVVHDRWLARCPRLGCANSESIGRCDDGSDGGLTGDRFTCRATHGGCGLVCEVVWPVHVDQITAVLKARPVPLNRNWWPPQSLAELVAENLDAKPPCPVPDAVFRLILTAAERRLPIGA